MKRLVLMLALAFGAGVVFGAIGYPIVSAQQPPTRTVTELLKADLVGMEGKELLVQISEFLPRASSGKHHHPGHEIAYVLSGSLIREVDGQPPAPMKVGTRPTSGRGSCMRPRTAARRSR